MIIKKPIHVVCVLGNWSSGTTAVTGYLSRLGADTCPPHCLTNDHRTPDSYESVAFRNACARTFDEITFEKIGSRKGFQSWLSDWICERKKNAKSAGFSHIVLKHPLSALLVREINEACAPNWIVVTRNFNEIENTRLRRRWYPSYGAAGAKKIYGSGFSRLIAEGNSFYSISFSDFIAKLTTRERLVDYIGMTPTETQKITAESWIR